MIGLFSWVLMAGAVYLFWTIDWRLGVGLVLAALSFMIDVGHGMHQLSEAIRKLDEKLSKRIG